MVEIAAAGIYRYFEISASKQAFDLAVGPVRRKSRQKVDRARVALHEQFGYAGRAAEVAVDLEWRGAAGF